MCQLHDQSTSCLLVLVKASTADISLENLNTCEWGVGGLVDIMDSGGVGGGELLKRHGRKYNINGEGRFGHGPRFRLMNSSNGLKKQIKQFGIHLGRWTKFG